MDRILSGNFGDPIMDMAILTDEEREEMQRSWEKYEAKRLRECVALELIEAGYVLQYGDITSAGTPRDIGALAEPIVQYILNGPKE